MRIQNLAVIFIIIILPISLILNSYVKNQAKTLSLQIDYDTRLNNATYDALKAFQLNTINSDSSDIANSKLRDINASVNSFFNSISTNFNMSGYNKGILEEYVPALVYTMYDGYYIYSPFTNTLDKTNENEVIVDSGTGETTIKSDAEILISENDNATYWEGQKLSGLKPYIFYSCRYLRGNDDFVINYSLDNYITIQGIINGKSVFEDGYILTPTNIVKNGDVLTYRDVEISKTEELKEFIVDSTLSSPKEYTYVKINGVKYYEDRYDLNNPHKWFSIMNGTRYYTDEVFNKENSAAIQYYNDAKDFTNKVLYEYGLENLSGSNAVEVTIYGEKKPIYQKDENGNDIEGQYRLGDYKIFDVDSGQSIEDPDSNFNQHRLAVIRYSIEKNLSIAIANYNNYSSVSTNFLMPELKEDEWDKILNNISIISFLQGLNIGGKVYNGYSIITNNKNKEVINENSIYISTSDGQYHRPDETDLQDNIEQGVLNIDFEIKSAINNSGSMIYYNSKQKYSSPYLGSYESIINQTGVDTTDNLYKYMADKRSVILLQYILQH